MNGSCRLGYLLASGMALGSAGCSLGDFGYLSADASKAAAGTSGSGGGGGAGGSAGAEALGGDAGLGGDGSGGTGGTGGTQPTAGNATAGTGGGEPPFFCDPGYQVFDNSNSGDPPVELPADGNYIVHKHDNATACLLTPDWPELEDKQYWAITAECGGPGTDKPTAPGQVWHFERICIDAYRLTVLHDTADERQLAMVDHTMVGTPLHSVKSKRSVDPSQVFQLRFEERVGETVRWRFSPVFQSSSCVEQISAAKYGMVDVTRVVLFPCTGNMQGQSWNFLPVP